MDVKLGTNYGLGDTLVCPVCKGEYLHHGAVTVFDRREDAETVRKTVVENGKASIDAVPNAKSGNPSIRRDGLSIDFWCEQCGDLDPDHSSGEHKRLHIAQHKGQTFMSWEIIKI